MPIEIAQFTVDAETHEEHYIRLRVLDTQESITYNTQCVTGTDETITVTQSGQVVRQSGERVDLADKYAPAPQQDNALSVGEVFLTGPTGRMLCIRRINYIHGGVELNGFLDDDYEWSLAALAMDGTGTASR